MNAKDFLIKYTFQDEEEAKDEQNERFARMMESYHQHKLRQANVSSPLPLFTDELIFNSSIQELLAKVHDDIEGRYDLTAEDLRDVEAVLTACQHGGNDC